MTKTSLTIENGIAHILMKDAKHLNALDIAMDQELLAQLQACEADETVKIIVLSGEGKAFSAGGDMHFFADMTTSKNYEALEDILVNVNRLILYIKRMKKLVIAAVHGHASGGGANLALACDFIIADASAIFTQSFTKIGLAPDAGAMYLLSKAIGARRAFDLCITGRPLKSSDAFTLGLISRFSKDGEVLKTAMNYAAELATGPLLAYELTKQQNYVVNYHDFAEYLNNTEEETVNKTFRSEDFKEGVQAFKEKRKPIYKGK